jgi:hypothetical protein
VTPAWPCHRHDPGVGGRALDDYRYSPAAKRANLVWGEAAPRACIADL